MLLGRLRTDAARRACAAGFVVLYPFVAWCSGSLEASPGLPGVLLTTGVALTLLVGVGPVAAPLLAVTALATQVLVLDGDLTAGLVTDVGVEVLVLAAAAVLVRARDTIPGRSRWSRLVEGLVVLCLLTPVLLVAAGAAVGLLSGEAPVGAVDLVTTAVAHAIGIVALTPGLLVALSSEPLAMDPGDSTIIAAGVAVTSAFVVVALVLGGSAVVEAQALALPLVLVGFLAGSAAYALTIAAVAVLATTVGTVVDPGGGLAVGQHVTWFVVAFGGMLLALEGDRRRRTTLKLAALFGHAAAASAEVAPSGRVLQVNRAFSTLVGWRSEELVDSDLLMLFASDDDGAGVEALIAGHRDEVRGMAELRTRSGMPRHVRYTGRRLRDLADDGGVLLVQMLDVTDEERRNEDLQRSNEALERLGSRIGHDLKQPLAAIAGYASTLRVQRERLDEATVTEMLDRLDQAARRVVDQLDTMVQSARVGGDAAEQVSIDAVVEAVRGLVAIELREEGGELVTALGVTHVQTDRRTLQRVLLNLVANALKYSGREQPPVVTVSSRRRGTGVEIAVVDRGPGIRHEHLEAVFEPGRRLAPEAAAGRGMGLADSRRAVEDLGGWLRAEPSAAGARLVLWLPDDLLGEDDTPIRTVLVELGHHRRHGLAPAESHLRLEHERVTVLERAASVAEGVDSVADHQPDVVVVDGWQPDEDGEAALARLGAAAPVARLVVRTTHESTVRAALVAGATRGLSDGSDGRAVAEAVIRAAG